MKKNINKNTTFPKKNIKHCYTKFIATKRKYKKCPRLSSIGIPSFCNIKWISLTP